MVSEQKSRLSDDSRAQERLFASLEHRAFRGEL